MSSPAFLLVALALASGDSSASSGSLELEAYGEMVYSNFDHGPDQTATPAGSEEDRRATVDLPRLVLGLEWELVDGLEIEAELEVEHGGTGSAIELEYEEFGEYEVEIEKAGEVVLEELHVTKTFSDALRLRVGHLIVPVGLLNRAHRPHQYFSAIRSEGEAALIPAVWHETGLMLLGESGDWGYRVALINGLDSTGFSSKFWIRGGHQTRFEETRATDLAAAFCLDWEPTGGLEVGVSAYGGNTTGNRPKPDMEGEQAYLGILEGHLTYARDGWLLRTMVLGSWLENSARVSGANRLLSANLEVPRTPVASRASQWSVELGYDLWAQDETSGLSPFVRMERYDSMAATAEGVFPVPRFDRRVMSVGMQWIPRQELVVTADWSRRTFGNEVLRPEQTARLALGFLVDAVLD